MHNNYYKMFFLLLFFFDKIHSSQSQNLNHKVIRRASTENIKELSPYRVTSYAERDVLTDIFEGLFKFTNDAKVVPAAAKYWHSNNDSTVWHFILRDDIYWSDGIPVVAEDFARGWKVLIEGSLVGKLTKARRNIFLEYRVPIKNALNKKLDDVEKISNLPVTDNNNSSELLGFLQNNNEIGVEVINDKELKLTLEFGVREEVLLQYICDVFFFPIRQDYLDKIDNWLDLPICEQNEILIPTNGAYTLKYFHRGQNICLVKNKFYRDYDNIYFDEVFTILRQTSDKLRLKFINNEIDIFAAATLKNDIFLNFLDYMKYTPQAGVGVVIFNLNDPILSNLKVRQAINYLIDKEHLFEKFIKKVFISDSIIQNFNKNKLKKIGFSDRMNCASTLLEDLGYTEKNPLCLNLYPQYVDGEILDIMHYLLNSIPNLKVDFNFVERSVLSEKISNRNFQLYFTMFRPHASWTAIDYFSWGYSNGNDKSISSYNNPEFLSILNTLIKENGSLSNEEVITKINRLEEITKTEVPYIQLCTITCPYVVKKDIKGVYEGPMYPNGTIPSALLYKEISN